MYKALFVVEQYAQRISSTSAHSTSLGIASRRRHVVSKKREYTSFPGNHSIKSRLLRPSSSPRTLIIALLHTRVYHPQVLLHIQYCYLHNIRLRLKYHILWTALSTKYKGFDISVLHLWERGEVGGAENTTAMSTLVVLSILYFWYRAFNVLIVFLRFVYSFFVLYFCISLYLCFSLLWGA